MRAAFVLLCALSWSARADELSGADKLRVVYSNQFAWTDDGLPVVTVRIAEGRDRVVLRGAGLRVYPDGEGGPEIRGGGTYIVQLERGRPGKVRYHVVVSRLPVGDDAALKAELARWRERGEHPAALETGALFAVRGEVLDQRRLLVTVGEPVDEITGRARVTALHGKFSVDAALQPELADRPAGIVEATDEHGTMVRNDAILWFASSGLIEVDDVDKEGGGREARRYSGRVYVTADRTGKLAVVNAVPEDRLLAGLVPAEMMASAPPEALKAQAIAARNELLAKIGTRHLTDPYRLCSTQHCQVYAGAGHEDPRATAAVSATRGVLLEREGGGLVDAVYSASCGGHTEDNEKVWGGVADGALRGRLDGDENYERARTKFAIVNDANVDAFIDGAADDGPQPYCARNRVGESTRQWTVKLDLPAIGVRLGIGVARTLTVRARGVSGRVSTLHVDGTTGSRDIKGELEVRRALGNLRSALFVVDGDTVRGLGHGHGIGMCQLGAMGMAERGAKVEQILRHYYRNAHLRRLY